MSIRAREGTTWVDPDRVVGSFVGGVRRDAQVVWTAAPGVTPPWRQVWPEPTAPRVISVGWTSVGGKSAIESISWSRVDADTLAPTHTKGDLVVRYTVALWWNPTAVATAPVVKASWATATPGAPGAEQAVPSSDNTWTLPAPIVLEDKALFAIEVTAHFDFHDGTDAVEQDPPVRRTSYFIGPAPVTPLPAPQNLTVTFATDRVGDDGHFRNAVTKAQMTGTAGRPAVRPEVEYVFDALGDGAAAVLSTSTRSVKVTTQANTPGRPAVAPATTTVYDFAAQDGQPALTGVPYSTRSYIKPETRSKAITLFGPTTRGPGTPQGFDLAPNESAVALYWTIHAVGTGSLTNPPGREIQVVSGGHNNGLKLGSGFGDVSGGCQLSQWGGPAKLQAIGSRWGGEPPIGSGNPHVEGTLRVELQVNVTQNGTARTVNLPWDGVAGHPGDPGTATGSTAVQTTVTQVGTPRTKAWDGVVGHPGDPGAPSQPSTTVAVWSWPFTFAFTAVPDAAAYEYSLNGGSWAQVPNVAPSALGPAATGTVSLTDRWVPSSPGSPVHVAVRAVKHDATGDTPGLVSVRDEIVPPPPTFTASAPDIVDKGYRYATVNFGVPALSAAAAHYHQGDWQTSTDGASWTTVFGQSSFVDAGEVPVNPVPTFRTGVAPAGTVVDNAGLPVDPGIATMQVTPGRPVTAHVRPVAAWGVPQAEAVDTDTLLPKIASWSPRQVAPSRRIAGAVTPARRDADIVTTPAPVNVLFGWLVPATPNLIPPPNQITDGRYYGLHNGGPGLDGHIVDNIGLGVTPSGLKVRLVAAPGIANPERLTAPPVLSNGQAGFAPAATGPIGSAVLFAIDAPPGWRILQFRSAWIVANDGLLRKGTFWFADNGAGVNSAWSVRNQPWWHSAGFGPAPDYTTPPIGFPGAFAPGAASGSGVATDARFFAFGTDFTSRYGTNIVTWSIGVMAQPPNVVTPGTFYPEVRAPDHFVHETLTYTPTLNAP